MSARPCARCSPPKKSCCNFGAGKMLVLPQGEHPIVADRFAYWQDPALNGLWDDPRQGGTRDVAGDAKASAKLGGLNAPPPAPPQPPTGGGGGPRPNPPPPIRPAPAAPAANATEAAAAPFAPERGGLGAYNMSVEVNFSGEVGDPLSGLAAMMREDSPAAKPEEPHEVDRYESGDIVYVMFSDGAVEVRGPDGVQRFPSLKALQEAAARQGK